MPPLASPPPASQIIPPCAKTRPSRHRRKNCASGNQAETLAREQVTWRPPTLDCGSTLMGPQARVTNIPSCRERTRSPLPLVIRPDTMVVWTARGQVMSKRMRQPIYGWLVLLVALGTAVVLTAGLLPGPWHSDGQGCTPCKVASQPTLLTAAPVTAEPPTQRASSAPQASEYRELSPASSLSAPRAPPA